MRAEQKLFFPSKFKEQIMQQKTNQLEQVQKVIREKLQENALNYFRNLPGKRKYGRNR